MYARILSPSDSNSHTAGKVCRKFSSRLYPKEADVFDAHRVERYAVEFDGKRCAIVPQYVAHRLDVSRYDMTSCSLSIPTVEFEDIAFTLGYSITKTIRHSRTIGAEPNNDSQWL